ncbi:MAG: peptidase M20, partial [Anaerolineae bacterium]
MIYIVLAALIVTTLYVVVRTVVFSWRQQAVEPIEGVPVDVDAVAEHLAAAVRCQTVPLDAAGTPDPVAFVQLHQMLAETYPLVHQSLKREVISGYSLLYTWQGSRADLEP